MQNYIREDYTVELTERGYKLTAAEPGEHIACFSATPNGFTSDNEVARFTETAEFPDPLPKKRCYFHILNGRRYSVCATRGVAIEPLTNLRDLGGYNTADGEWFVKPGLLYRSDALNRLDAEGIEKLGALGLKYILDFRSARECVGAEDPELVGCEMRRVSALEFDGEEGEFDLSKFLTLDLETRKNEMADVIEGYTQMPFGSNAYAELFGRLLKGDAPMLFHCAAGKDRTGIAAALILLTLGVPREAAVYDYMLTDEFRRHVMQAMLADFERELEHPEAVEIMQVILSVKQQNIEMTLDAVFERYGSFERYLKAEYNIGAAELKKLRGMYLIKH